MADRGFSQISARGNFNTGSAIRGIGAYYGSMYFVNSAQLDGTSGGNSALIRMVVRPNVGWPWSGWGNVITATHSLSGHVALTGTHFEWATLTLSAFSANG